MLPIFEVQAQLFAALVPALAPVPVIDSGTNLAYPYVALGDSQGGQDDGLNNEAHDFTVTLYAYSRQPGTMEAAKLLSAIYDAINRQKYPLPDGRQWVDTIFQSSNILPMFDGVTRQGIIRFSVLTYKP